MIDSNVSAAITLATAATQVVALALWIVCDERAAPHRANGQLSATPAIIIIVEVEVEESMESRCWAATGHRCRHYPLLDLFVSLWTSDKLHRVLFKHSKYR